MGASLVLWVWAGVMYQDFFPTTPLLPLPDDTHVDTYEISTMSHADIAASQLQVIIPRILALPRSDSPLHCRL